MVRHDEGRSIRLLLFGLPTILLTCASPTVAQTTEQSTPAATSDAEWRRQMETRMEQLEKENAQLRKQVGEVSETQQAVMKDAQSRGLLALEAGQPRLTTPDWFDVNKYAAEGDFPG